MNAGPDRKTRKAGQWGSAPAACRPSNQDVNPHYWRNEVPHFDPWDLLPPTTCPVLVLAGEDDPLCPPPIVEDLASQLPADTTRQLKTPGWWGRRLSVKQLRARRTYSTADLAYCGFGPHSPGENLAKDAATGSLMVTFSIAFLIHHRRARSVPDRPANP
jgi:hypothetical protein